MASKYHQTTLAVLLDAINLKLSVEIEIGQQEVEKEGAAAYVEGDDDAGGVVVGQLDGSAEVSMVVRRLGYAPGA